MAKTKTLKSDKAHQAYYIEENGKKVRVPGVTTITGVLDKPALKYWGNRIGLEGIDIKNYVDKRAEMGTLAHAMVEAFLLKETVDTTEYSQVAIDAAENAFLSFLEWEKKHTYEVHGIEMQLTSKSLRVGGTCDIYWTLDGVPTLTDLKTGSGIYPEMKVQACAYADLLLDNGHLVESVSILNIPREEDERFEYCEIQSADWDIYAEAFRACRRIYDLKKKVKWY